MSSPHFPLLFAENTDTVQRARAYLIHHAPLDNPVAGPGGNPGIMGFTSYGCPVYSAGESRVTETMLIDAQPAVLKWIQKVALEGEAYKNEAVEVFGDEGGITSVETDSPWGIPEADAAPGNETAQKTDTKADDGVLDGKDSEAQMPEKDGNAIGAKVQADGQTVQAAKDSAPHDGPIKDDSGKPECTPTDAVDRSQKTKKTVDLKKVEGLKADMENLKVQEEELKADMDDLMVPDDFLVPGGAAVVDDMEDLEADLEDFKRQEQEFMAGMDDLLE